MAEASGAGSTAQVDAQKAFAKLGVLFPSSRATDAKLIKDLEQLVESGYISNGYINLNQLIGAGKKSCLHYAVEGKRVSVVEWLLTNKVDPNVPTETGDTALHLLLASAPDSKGIDMIELLLKYGASRTLPNKANQTPDDLSGIVNINLDTPRIKQSKKKDTSSASAANTGSSSGTTSNIVSEAEQQQRDQITQLKEFKMLQKQLTIQLTELVEYKDDPVKRSELSRSVFSTLMNPTNSTILTEKGMVDKNVNVEQRAMIHLAAEADDVLVTHALLKCKANPNKQDTDGETALHIACKYGYTNIIKVLLADPRTDTTLKTFVSQMTAFEYASKDNKSYYTGIVRDKNLRISVAQLVSTISTDLRNIAAEAEKKATKDAQKDKEDKLQDKLKASGLGTWSVMKSGPYLSSTYGNTFTPIETIVEVQGDIHKRPLGHNTIPSKKKTTTTATKPSSSTASKRTTSAAHTARSSTPNSIPSKDKGPKLSIRARLEARGQGNGNDPTSRTASRAQSRRSSHSDEKPASEQNTMNLPNGKLAVTQLDAIHKCAKYIYHRLQYEDVFNYDNISNDIYNPSVSVYSSHYRSTYTSDKQVYQLFRIFKEIYPSVPTLYDSVLDDIYKELGDITSDNCIQYVICFINICSRYTSMTWDFTLLDCHHHTQAQLPSKNMYDMKPTVYNTDLYHQYGDLYSNIASPASLGGIPAYTKELLTNYNGFNRAQMYEDDIATTERLYTKRSIVERKRAQKDDADYIPTTEPYGRYDNETNISITYKDMLHETNILEIPDIIEEMKGMGYLPL